jgi:hypothetical protein
MLKQIEVWPTRFVERDDFAVHNRVLRELVQRLNDVRILPVKQFAITREEIQFAVRVDGDGSIPVELDLVDPVRTLGRLGDGETLHGLDEPGLTKGKGF